MISIEFTITLKQLIQDRKRILFLGIGENRMSDDGFGPYLSHRLLQQISTITSKKQIKIINGKTDYIERKPEILEFQPDLLLILDTCQPNDNKPVTPGNLQLNEESELVNWLPLSSHVLPIPVFISELKMNLPQLKTALIGIIPISTDYTDEVVQFQPEKYSLDDYDKDPDLPFYDFNLSPTIQKITDELVDILLELLKNTF